MRIAFLGTPDFAVPSLEALYDRGDDITVFTQPDRPKGRGGKMAMPEVKEKALSLGIPVKQFEKISTQDGVEALREFAPDLMVTAAFGQILSKEVLDIPKFGCINVHASLLPEYRGAAPIQQVIEDGKKVTGVTTMMTETGLDTGDILCVIKTQIGENETAGELFDRLSHIGGQCLIQTIEKLENGTLTRTPQDHSKATKCRTIKKEHGKIDFTKSAQKIHDLVRAMNPWPCAYCELNGEIIRIHRTLMHPEITTDSLPGTCIVANSKEGLFVATGDGVLEITQIQLPGKKAMDAKALLNGKKMLGEVLG